MLYPLNLVSVGNLEKGGALDFRTRGACHSHRAEGQVLPFALSAQNKTRLSPFKTRLNPRPGFRPQSAVGWPRFTRRCLSRYIYHQQRGGNVY